MPGAFDGGGAFLADSNTIRIHVNHETTNAKISEVDVNKEALKSAIYNMMDGGTTGGVPFVQNARRAYSSIVPPVGSSHRFCRFCSSQAYEPNTFGPNRGFVDYVYITGEECFTTTGRLVALDSSTRTLYILSGITGSAPGGGTGGMPLDSWENAALIDTGETAHVALLLSPDGGTKRMKLYIGIKGKDANGNASNSFLARNGLAYGYWYHLKASLPESVGGTVVDGSFGVSTTGALEAVKLEDIDTSPSDPTRVVLGVQRSGVFVFQFTLDFSLGNFDAESSSFTLTKVAGSISSNLNSPDNVDWTHPTTLGSTTYPEGIVFVNEDNASGEIWSMRPDGSDKIRIGSTTVGSEGTGLFDLSELVDFAPGSILVTSSQGSPSSMTVLINPDAVALEPQTHPHQVPLRTTFDAEDTQIWQVNPNTNYGSLRRITVDLEDGGGFAMGLIKFPGLSIPAGSSLVSASLAIHCRNDSPGTVSAYRMLLAWNVDHVTWNTFDNGVAIDGVQASSTPSFRFVEPPGSGWVTANVTSDVSLWLSGAPNQGWVLRNNLNDGWDFDSAETASGPVLTVFYTPPPLGSSLTFHAVDSQIWQVRPNLNFGSLEDITVDKNDGGGEAMALLQFPGLDDEIPVGAFLVSATLEIHCNNYSPGTVSAYRMFVAWIDSNVKWNTFGGNGIANDGIEASAVASFSFVEPPGSGVVTADVTSDVRLWLSGTPNHGWVLINNVNDGWDFDSAETGNGPRLLVEWEDPSWEVIDGPEDFETDWGIWKTNHGPDVHRVYSRFSPSGWYSMRLRDSTASSRMTTDPLAVGLYSHIQISFDFFPWSMEDGEDFFLESSMDGTNWVSQAHYISGTGGGLEGDGVFYFRNRIVHSENVVVFAIHGPTLFLQFRCDASANNDRVYIDNVEIQGKRITSP